VVELEGRGMNEYLVEITAGLERVYHSLPAFREAIQAGEINPESRIYHRAAARWIPITEHPEYRKYLAERRPANWLEPIPFEPGQESEPHKASHGLRSLVAKLERAGATVRGWLARRPPPSTPLPRRTFDVPDAQHPADEPSQPVARSRSSRSASRAHPTPSHDEEANPAEPQKGWTFLP
jgi:hypothetical protein